MRLAPRRQGRTAPFSSDFSGSGTIKFSSKTNFWPSPWQIGHAPSGELNEKCLGVGGSEAFAGGRAVMAVGMKGFGPRRSGRARALAGLRENQQAAIAPLQGGLDGIAEADADFFVDDQPIDDVFDGVARFGVEFDADVAAQFDEVAVDAGADEAFAGRGVASMTSRNSPFCWTTTGARSMTRVLGGRARILSTMSLVVWRLMGWPLAGQ